ncbi:MAG: beta-galactosidase [Eubacteriales bacterium]|nr:beta-galactosidase [Eubacteriales bacterium]
MDRMLFGAAYYDEYMPYDRLEQDIRMMKDAHINVVRIAESTWSTCEPQNGVFDFSHVTRVLDAMEKNGIDVIIGTPTYAFPAWLAAEQPDVLAVTQKGPERYGKRQNMDITHPGFRFYAQRVIRKLMEVSAHRRCVIGFQLDNETKHYNTAGRNVQLLFQKHLRRQFGTLDEINRAFGLDYWSNRIDAWEDFPDVLGTINGSLGAAFAKFQRTLVDEYLAWQAGIVKEYKRDDQFITHNFDYEWRGHSYGLQPQVNHFTAAKCLSVAGVDIYHPSQQDLTGAEIALGGDISRSLKGDNYLVIETQAQAFPHWTPFEGQLRLQAFSHLASGANSVMYWHWHSIHNSYETYWKGLLSHDFGENPTYLEAKTIGRDFARWGGQLINLKKQNRVAILVSNESYTALEWFPPAKGCNYNDVLRWIYDCLYRQNVETDFLFPESDNLEDYDVIVVPALYSAPDSLLERLKSFVHAGGHLVATFKTGFTDEHVQVSTLPQPRILSECCGVTYSQFVLPRDVTLRGLDLAPEDTCVSVFMELVTPTTAQVLAAYDHPHWGKYAAVTRNTYGEGCATYIAGRIAEPALSQVLKQALCHAGVWGDDQLLAFPVILRKGINDAAKQVRYYFNYSDSTQHVVYRYGAAHELTQRNDVSPGDSFELAPWDMRIFVEQ